jgi:hypothetical protein
MVAIDRIYIPSKLKIKQESPMLKEMLALDQGARRGRDKELQPDKEIGKITYNDFRSGFRRAVVLGDPGGGKSTLCQYLCYHLSKQSNLAQQLDNSQRTAYDGKFDQQFMKVPLRVVLRSFESVRVTSPQLSIFDYIVNDLKTVSNATSLTHLQDFLRYTLMYGYAVLAFDGLDEILNTATRRDFVDLVTEFCDEFPLCPVFVTSRVVGYEDAPLREDFEEFALEKFDDKEVIQYVVKFLKVFSSEKQASSEAKANVFLRQTHGTASDLRQNPLMLGLMTFLFATKGDVPTNRPEIYKECAILMFEKWDQNRNIKADIPLGFDMLHLFGEIASEIYGDPKLEEGVDEVWINKRNTRYFMKIYEDRAKAFEAAKKVTEFVTGRSWVMSEFGPDNYRFTHRTFMEYFFARHLEERNETILELLDVIMPHVKERQWDVISHLALQVKTFRNQKRTEQAIEALKARVDASAGQQRSSIEVANFFASALSYLMPSEMDCKSAALELARAAFQIVELRDAEAATYVFRTLCTCVIERRVYVQRVLGDVLETTLRDDGREPTLFFCAMLLSDKGKVPPYWPSPPIPLAEGVRDDVQRRVKQNLYRRAITNASWAYIYTEWYHDSFGELYSIHGSDMILNDLRPWSRGSTGPNLIVSLVVGVTQGNYVRRVPALVREWAVECLETIGRMSNAGDLLSRKPDSRQIRLAPHLWNNAVAATKNNVFAFRGLLLLYRLVDDSANRVEQGDPAMMHRWQRPGQGLYQRISKLIGRSASREKEMFEFWPKAPPSPLKASG